MKLRVSISVVFHSSSSESLIIIAATRLPLSSQLSARILEAPSGAERL